MNDTENRNKPWTWIVPLFLLAILPLLAYSLCRMTSQCNGDLRVPIVLGVITALKYSFSLTRYERSDNAWYEFMAAAMLGVVVVFIARHFVAGWKQCDLEATEGWYVFVGYFAVEGCYRASAGLAALVDSAHS